MTAPDPRVFSGAPAVYYINLARAEDRRAHMEAQLAAWGLKAVRIDAIDGAATPPSAFLVGETPDDATPARLACYASHLEALASFVADGAARGLIMEDDCSFDTVPHWPFTWAEAEAHLPFDADIVQLSLISDRTMTMKLHRRLLTNYSSAAYLVTRRYAEKLLALHRESGVARFDQAFRPELTSEIMLFEPGSAYTAPLFTIDTTFPSSLREDHVNALHKPCRNIALRFWREVAPEIDDWRVLFDYDPAFGRTAPATTPSRTL